MNKNLPTIKQEAELILGKSNNLINITNKILTTRSTTLAKVLQHKPYVQIGHTSSAFSVTLSPDGKTALSGGGDKTLKLWDVNTGRVIRTLQGHMSNVMSIVFSPDGKTALSGSSDKTLKLWDVNTGREVGTFEGHTDEVRFVNFSPDGKTALSRSNNDTVKIWNIGTGEVIRTFAGKATFVTFSQDWKTGITIYLDHILVEIWDVATGKEIGTFDKNAHMSGLRFVTFSPDGRTALSKGWRRTVSKWDYDTLVERKDGTLIKLWDISTGKVILTFEGDTDSILSVSFSPDGKTALSVSSDNYLKLWDINTGKEIRTFYGLGREHYLALGSDVHEWMRAYDGEHSLRSAAFSPDGKMALSIEWHKGCGDNGTDVWADSSIKLWDIGTGEVIRTFESTLTEYSSELTTSITFSSDGKTAITRSRGTEAIDSVWNGILARVWDVGTGKVIRNFNEGRNNSNLDDISFDENTGEVIYKPNARINDKVRSITFDRDGKSALMAMDNYSIKLWDINADKLIRTFDGAKGVSLVNSVAFSPDGRMALSASDILALPDLPQIFSEGPLRLWDVSVGEVVQTFKGKIYDHSSTILSPDKITILSITSDRALVELLDIGTREVIRVLDGHVGGVNSAAFSPDGKMALTGGNDSTLKLWNVNTGEMIRVLNGHTDRINSVAFSPDGKTALSGSEDNTLKLWDICTGEVIRTMVTFTDGEWVSITHEGYFKHSKNGRQYLNVLTSQMSAIEIDDVTYNHYYQPNVLTSPICVIGVDDDTYKHYYRSNEVPLPVKMPEVHFPEIDINEDEIPF